MKQGTVALAPKMEVLLRDFGVWVTRVLLLFRATVPAAVVTMRTVTQQSLLCYSRPAHGLFRAEGTGSKIREYSRMFSLSESVGEGEGGNLGEASPLPGSPLTNHFLKTLTHASGKRQLPVTMSQPPIREMRERCSWRRDIWPLSIHVCGLFFGKMTTALVLSAKSEPTAWTHGHIQPSLGDSGELLKAVLCPCW